MKHILLLSSIFIFLTSFQSSNQAKINNAYLPGEKLVYRLHYGFITAGEAVVRVQDHSVKVKGKDCYDLNIQGRTTGAFAAAMRVEDEWQSYVDKKTLQPVQCEREIIESSYYLREKVEFNKNVAKVTWNKRDKVKKHEKYKIVSEVYDIVSAYYHLRNIDFDNMNKGDKVSVKTFFEDKMYDFQVEYRGKDKIRTKLGKMNAIKLRPIMPDNELFDGEDSINFWLSDDKNRIPLKVKAEMFVGAVEVDIKKVSGLRHDLNKA